MPSADDFLQAILASPDDDTPRLVYADWLEERGDPRGEFIRLQCELARLPLSNPRVVPMRERERELVETYHRIWLGPLYDLTHFRRFHRGFVEEVTVDGNTFLDKGEELFRRAPIRHVLFYNAGPLISALVGVPYLGKAPSLDFRYNQLGDAGVQTLVCSTYLGRVTTLSLVGNDIGDMGVSALTMSPWLPALVTLKLSENHITDIGALMLAHSRHLARLRCVDLRRTWGSEEVPLEVGRRFEEVLVR